MIKRAHKVAGMTLTAVVVLSGCGGTKPGEPKPSSKPTSTAAANPDSLSDTTGTRDTNGRAEPPLDGNWVHLDRGSFARLLIDDRKVELFSGHHCRGRASKEDGLWVLRLKCDDGNTDRTVGRVYALSSKTMTVGWDGFGGDIFQQTKRPSNKARTAE
ncbi:hypothetical protein [Streptomyces sp. NPDC052721]|uniref:hypothetical protein n=1 Tax=Streptomyces sp. NPDC052721 TaxID=3154955 RepID=UPI00342A51FB